MQNQTHYWFAFACNLSFIYFGSDFSMINRLLLLLLIPIVSWIALLPNILDRYFCRDRETQTCTEKCRHPVTHGPFVFLLAIVILTQNTSTNSWYGLIVSTFILAYGSHLFLDIFSHEGIPLGFLPTLFLQDPAKNYVFNSHEKRRMRLRMPTDRFLRDNRRTNHCICLGSKLIIFLIGLQFILDLKDVRLDYEMLINVVQYLNSLQMGGI